MSKWSTSGFSAYPIIRILASIRVCSSLAIILHVGCQLNFRGTREMMDDGCGGINANRFSVQILVFIFWKLLSAPYHLRIETIDAMSSSTLSAHGTRTSSCSRTNFVISNWFTWWHRNRRPASTSMFESKSSAFPDRALWYIYWAASGAVIDSRKMSGRACVTVAAL